MTIKIFRKKEVQNYGKGFFLRIILSTHKILKNTQRHLVWKKFVLFPFFFLIYTKHSLKKPGVWRGGKSAPHL